MPKTGIRSDFGVDFGAHTTTNDSGNMRWNPECVCRSTENMKPEREMIIEQKEVACGHGRT